MIFLQDKCGPETEFLAYPRTGHHRHIYIMCARHSFYVRRRPGKFGGGRFDRCTPRIDYQPFLRHHLSKTITQNRTGEAPSEGAEGSM
jgi:hypothetical protein